MTAKLPEWSLLAMITLILWGFWGFLPAAAAKYLSDARSMLLYSTLGSIMVALMVFTTMGFKPEVHARGIGFALLTGVCETTGILLYMYAVTKGPGHLSAIVTTTSLYPIVTVLLSFLILRERLSLRQGIGIVFALLAIVFINWPSDSTT